MNVTVSQRVETQMRGAWMQASFSPPRRFDVYGKLLERAVIHVELGGDSVRLHLDPAEARLLAGELLDVAESAEIAERETEAVNVKAANARRR